MYSTTTHFADTISAALSTCLSAFDTDKYDDIAVLGGHYMLMYDQTTDALAPVVWQEQTRRDSRLFAQLMAGNFPVNTLLIAIRLQSLFQTVGKRTRLAMVVNDHKFQTKKFQPAHIMNIIDKVGDLRKNYFKMQKLPETYLTIFKNEGINHQNLLLDNSDIRREPKSILPKENIFFSEQVLQRHFHKRIKKATKRENGTRVDIKVKNEKMIMYSTALHEDVCLMEDGSCGCAGLIVELLGKLFEKQIYGIILLVPDECAEAVNAGVVLAQEFYQTNCMVLCVSQLGGAGTKKLVDYDQLSNLRIDFYPYQPQTEYVHHSH